MKRKRASKRQTSGNHNAVGRKEQEAFIDFVSRNAQAQIEQDDGFNQFDDEDHNGVEFEPEDYPDSNSTSFVMRGGPSFHDESTSLIDRTIQKLVNKYGQEKLVTVDSLMKVGNVQSNSLTCSGFLNKCQRDSETPCQYPPYNKKELSYALSVIRRIMKMDAAIPFNVSADPTALRLHDYFDVIHTPMDFGTIRRHLENGNKYMNSEDVLKDVECIWQNCYKYYDKGNYILDLMERVKESFIKYWTAAGLFTEEPRITHDLKNPCAEKRKGRGPTRNLRLAAMPEGDKFDIAWRNQRPVGANSMMFKAECTILVRQTCNIPLQVKGWMEIPFDIKKKLFEHMLERFNVEDKMKWVLSQIRRSYNNYRYHLRCTWYDTCKTIEEARVNVPPNVTEDDWQYLVNLWSSSAWQERSKKNKENCAKSIIVNKFGSKSSQQWHEDVREKTGREPSPTVLWEITHAWPDGQAANQSSQGVLSKLKRLSTQVCKGTSQMSEREIFAPQHPGQVHDRGNSATLKKFWGASSSTVYEIKNQLLESEHQREEPEQCNVAEVQSLKEQVSRIEVLSCGDGDTTRKFQDSSSSNVKRLKEQLLVSEQHRNETEQHNAAEVRSVREWVSQVGVPSCKDGATPRKFQDSSSSTVNRHKEQLLVSEQHCKESEQHNAAEVLSLRERVSQVDIPSYRDGATPRKFQDSSLSSVNWLKEQLLVSKQRCKDSEQYRKESEQHNATEVLSLRERVSQVDVPSYGDGATPRELRDSSSTVHQLKKQLLVSEQRHKESEQHNTAEVRSLRERVCQVEAPSYGDAATPKRLHSSSSTVNELKKHLLETEQRREESEQRSASEVQSLKEQVRRVEGLLSEQMNRFEGLLAQMISQMSSPAQVECRTADPPSRGIPLDFSSRSMSLSMELFDI